MKVELYLILISLLEQGLLAVPSAQAQSTEFHISVNSACSNIITATTLKRSLSSPS